MWEEIMWLGVPKEELKKWEILEGDLTGRFAYFRCELTADKMSSLQLRIGASSRYRLWINGRPVLSGPCKGDLYHCYYDIVDVSEYLTEGKNVLAVQVLYQDPYAAVSQIDERAAIFGMVSPGGGHRLAIEGDVRDKKGEITDSVSTGKAVWKVWLDGSFYLKSYPVTANFGAVCEEIDFDKSPANWKDRAFDDSDWNTAKNLEPVLNSEFFEKVGVVKRFPLQERTIPLMYEKDCTFLCEMKFGRTSLSELLQGTVTIPPFTTRELLIDAGAVVNGYPVFPFQGGEGSHVSIVYFEKFMHPEKEIPRDDWEHGMIEGRTDQLVLSGEKISYEPFWYRTFRFIQITVQTQKESVRIGTPVYRRTGYPLGIRSWVSSSEAWINRVWEMCVRTLENCMMETYMDCPYYEQMQFPMDTRLQALFNFTVSDDTRLAKKALEDLHSSITPEGLVQGKYPSAYLQIISTFSLHYIYMLEEYYQQTGDLEGIRAYLPDIDRIFNYYDRKKGSLGLVEHLGYWEFVDWQPAWAETYGAPRASQDGPSSIINLMYGYALLCGAKLYEVAKRPEIAGEYRRRQKEIAEGVWKFCWDEERGMFREGPKLQEYTQHAQAWAILNHLADRGTGQDILRRAAKEDDVLKVSFSTSYEWFRALEQMGMYEESEKNMNQWVHLADMGCTTCPETPGISRSECHAWSALPMYEMVRCFAGIYSDRPGWGHAVIAPKLLKISDLEGEIMTPSGPVKFSYRKDEQGIWHYEGTLPEGLEASFIYPDGRMVRIPAGEQFCF